MIHPTTPTLIDWLSISGKSRGIKPIHYKKVRLNYGTSVFKAIDELYYNNNRICTITSQPYSSVICPDLFIIKFDNWVLYSDRFYNYFAEVIKESGLYEYQISRIDIAKDFNRFYKGRKPANLIKEFLSMHKSKLGIQKYNVWGETRRILTYDYLAFGKKSSIVNTYLYNKTLEMQQVKHKPWITNKWNEHNLKSSEPVFRLEFSIKKSELSFINTETGENFLFNITHIFDQDVIEDLYLHMLSKNFRFKYNSGKKNISREREVILFKFGEYEKIIWESVKPLETNRADKIFLRKLDNLYSELRHEDVQLFNKIEDVKSLFTKKKNLSDWVRVKLNPETQKALEHPSYFGADIKEECLASQPASITKEFKL